MITSVQGATSRFMCTPTKPKYLAVVVALFSYCGNREGHQPHMVQLQECKSFISLDDWVTAWRPVALETLPTHRVYFMSKNKPSFGYIMKILDTFIVTLSSVSWLTNLYPSLFFMKKMPYK